MNNFRLPEKVGSDYEKPVIIEIKEIKKVNIVKDERTFSCDCDSVDGEPCSCQGGEICPDFCWSN